MMTKTFMTKLGYEAVFGKATIGSDVKTGIDSRDRKQKPEVKVRVYLEIS